MCSRNSWRRASTVSRRLTPRSSKNNFRFSRPVWTVFDCRGQILDCLGIRSVQGGGKIRAQRSSTRTHSSRSKNPRFLDRGSGWPVLDFPQSKSRLDAADPHKPFLTLDPILRCSKSSLLGCCRAACISSCLKSISGRRKAWWCHPTTSAAAPCSHAEAMRPTHLLDGVRSAAPRHQFLPTSAFPTLLRLKPNFDKTATTTSTTRPPLHTALCSVPMLTGPSDDAGPSPR